MVHPRQKVEVFIDSAIAVVIVTIADFLASSQARVFAAVTDVVVKVDTAFQAANDLACAACARRDLRKYRIAWSAACSAVIGGDVDEVAVAVEDRFAHFVLFDEVFVYLPIAVVVDGIAGFTFGVESTILGALGRTYNVALVGVVVVDDTLNRRRAAAPHAAVEAEAAAL